MIGKIPNPKYKSLSKCDSNCIFFWKDQDNHYSYPQRSDEWKDFRSTIVFPSSDISTYLGLSEFLTAEYLNMPIWMISHDRVVNLVKKEEFNPPHNVQVNLDWGIYHENNATQTVLSSIYLDQKYPSFKIAESGIWHTKYNNFNVGSSFDGIIVYHDKPVCLYETKCISPYKYDRYSQEYRYQDPLPHTYIPAQYYVQMQMQLYLASKHLDKDIDTNYMISWTPSYGTHMIQMKRNDNLIQMILDLLDHFYTEFIDVRKDVPENFWWNKDHPVYNLYMDFLFALKMDMQKIEIVEKLPSICSDEFSEPFL